MTPEEYILHLISRSPDSKDQDSKESEWTTDSALSLLLREYPNLDNLIAGQSVLDFACGLGFQSVAMALKYDCSVVGLDTNRKLLERGKILASLNNVPESKISFKDRISEDMKGSFDIVLSQNSFEHFHDPEGALRQMKELVAPVGSILITFGPPWLAPYGSHMQFFCRFPWINILFSEKTVMKVRCRFRSDGATKYEEVESGLNRLTVKRFEKTIATSGLAVEFQKYSCVKRWDILGRVPGLREFFINHISVILSVREASCSFV